MAKKTKKSARKAKKSRAAKKTSRPRAAKKAAKRPVSRKAPAPAKAPAAAEARLVLYDLAPSPNSIKVRIALRFKGLPFRKVAVNPQDRSEIVRLSRQPLTPILLHGDRVVYDSAGILRYLDANFPSAPSIFSADYDEMKEIEKWERFGRTEVNQHVGLVFGEFFAERKNPANLQRANELLQQSTAQIEERLAAGPFLAGGRLTAADITAAPYVHYGMLPSYVAASSPIAAFFAQHLRLGEGRERTREWVRRVMAYDK